MAKHSPNYRPASYFDDAIKALLATIKGAVRKREALDRIKRGDLTELEGWLVASKLPDDERESFGAIHPAFMGGEYLPDYLPGEVEIARISLESTTADVITVRARLGGGKIHYRIVDEYETEYVITPTESDLPLTFGELIAMIDGGHGEGMNCAPAAFWEQLRESGTDPDEIASFVTVTSDYYPEITEYYEERFEEWLSQSGITLDGVASAGESPEAADPADTPTLEIDNLIETLEILRDAVDASDGDKAFEAVTILLFQCTPFCGCDPAVFLEMFPFLEQLKDHIQSGNFSEARILTLAFLAKFRAARSKLLSTNAD